MKDLFSQTAVEYATYRPGYPKALMGFLLSKLESRDTAWDCGTGNGQMAKLIAPSFREVCATDISEKQLQQAEARSNIFYSVSPAEDTEFPDDYFDLITVAQAIHWFDFHAFYREVYRTAKPGALLAVAGYGLLHINPELDAVVNELYNNILGKYWEPERKFIDEKYQTIPFPFHELEAPHLQVRCNWNLDQLTGYLGTWSAVNKYKDVNGSNPVFMIQNDLEKAWGDEESQTITFPVLLRVGRIKA